jgi:hypothetical protein
MRLGIRRWKQWQARPGVTTKQTKYSTRGLVKPRLRFSLISTRNSGRTSAVYLRRQALFFCIPASETNKEQAGEMQASSLNQTGARDYRRWPEMRWYVGTRVSVTHNQDAGALLLTNPILTMALGWESAWAQLPWKTPDRSCHRGCQASRLLSYRRFQSPRGTRASRRNPHNNKALLDTCSLRL